MAIARKPNSKPKPPVTDDAADAFIAGAAKPAAPAIAEAAEDELSLARSGCFHRGHHCCILSSDLDASNGNGH